MRVCAIACFVCVCVLCVLYVCVRVVLCVVCIVYVFPTHACQLSIIRKIYMLPSHMHTHTCTHTRTPKCYKNMVAVTHTTTTILILYCGNLYFLCDQCLCVTPTFKAFAFFKTPYKAIVNAWKTSF